MKGRKHDELGRLKRTSDRVGGKESGKYVKDRIIKELAGRRKSERLREVR